MCNFSCPDPDYTWAIIIKNHQDEKKVADLAKEMIGLMCNEIIWTENWEYPLICVINVPDQSGTMHRTGPDSLFKIIFDIVPGWYNCDPLSGLYWDHIIDIEEIDLIKYTSIAS